MLRLLPVENVGQRGRQDVPRIESVEVGAEKDATVVFDVCAAEGSEAVLLASVRIDEDRARIFAGLRAAADFGEGGIELAPVFAVILAAPDLDGPRRFPRG